MAPEADVHDRIQRAESQPMEIEEVTTDPLVLQVYNEESDRFHTVVPESPHCSCEDSTYRDTICKHVCAVAQTDRYAETAYDHLAEEHKSVVDEIEEIEDRLDHLHDRREQLLAVLDSTGLHQMEFQPGANVEQIPEATDEEIQSIFAGDGGNWSTSNDSENHTFQIVEDEEDEDDVESLADELTRGSGAVTNEPTERSEGGE